VSIVIIDFGVGNLGSIANMLKKIGVGSITSSDTDVIENADKLILPGVGSFDEGVQHLCDLNLISVLNKKVIQDRVPILGICLGMQLFTKRSEEGELPGLGWIDAETVKFDFTSEAKKLTVPHMGWNFVKPVKDSDLFLYINSELRYYFVHSYHVVCERRKDVFSTTNYGIEFVSSIKRDNILGVQFHPEKSHRFGMSFLSRFCE